MPTFARSQVALPLAAPKRAYASDLPTMVVADAAVTPARDAARRRGAREKTAAGRLTSDPGVERRKLCLLGSS